MKKTIITFSLVTLMIFPAFTHAQNDNAGDTSKSVTTILQEIRQAQHIQPTDPISCDKTTDQQFEELGNTAMEVMIGDNKQHELMDQMMGGDGSRSLSAMHTMMGQRYLGCGGYGLGMMGMMGGLPFYSFTGINGNVPSTGTNQWKGGGNMMDFIGSGMMGGFGGFGIGWILMVLFWVLFIMGIIFFIRSVITPGQSSSSPSTRNALDILKERYARGEIDKKEFESMKKDLL